MLDFIARITSVHFESLEFNLDHPVKQISYNGQQSRVSGKNILFIL